VPSSTGLFCPQTGSLLQQNQWVLEAYESDNRERLDFAHHTKGAFFSALLLVATLIWMLTLSLAFVCHTMDELEQIRTRKIAEMMNRPEKPQGSSRSVGPAVLTDANFDSAIKANPLVVVDCWAAWCYPCRMIAPIVEKLASEYSSVATFWKLNVDENPSTSMRYGIQSIPTILVIKNGVEVDRIIGVVPKVQIETVLKKHL